MGVDTVHREVEAGLKSMGMAIQAERPGDAAAIDAVTTAVFLDAPHTSHTEQFIVAALRRAAGARHRVAPDAGGVERAARA